MREACVRTSRLQAWPPHTTKRDPDPAERGQGALRESAYCGASPRFGRIASVAPRRGPQGLPRTTLPMRRLIQATGIGMAMEALSWQYRRRRAPATSLSPAMRNPASSGCPSVGRKPMGTSARPVPVARLRRYGTVLRASNCGPAPDTFSRSRADRGGGLLRRSATPTGTNMSCPKRRSSPLKGHISPRTTPDAIWECQVRPGR